MWDPTTPHNGMRPDRAEHRHPDTLPLMRPASFVLALAIGLTGCGGGASEPDPARFCEIYAEVTAIDPYAGSPQDQVATGRRIQGLLEEAVEVAPDDIAADAEATLEAFERVLEIVTGGLTGGIDGARLIEANTNLERAAGPLRAWVATNCAPGDTAD